ncbi:MAG: alkaline phosphatase family protein [Clostridia bacterium]|nr:alkaline phosphatase family protein [Clostridia bacterium]
MADHFNMYHLKHFAGTVAQCMDFQLPEAYAPGITWVSRILKERLGGNAERVILYHADAVGMYMWQKYTNILAPVYKHTSLALPFCSTVRSVTPVAHASMYTGLMPEEHGIQTYVRPQLECSTLYDELIKVGKRPVIVAQHDSSFLHIFKGRDMKVYDCPTGYDTVSTALKVIEEDDFDLLSIHVFDYDNAAHSCGPEAKESKNALSIEAEGFDRIADAAKMFGRERRTLLSYSPDHGQHLTEGGGGGHGSEMPEDMNVLHFFGTI